MCREIPHIALSRLQHEFEPRWRHKIKTASDQVKVLPPCAGRQSQHELREQAGSETSTAALDVAAFLGRFGSVLRSCSRSFCHCHRDRTRRLHNSDLDLQSLARHEVARRELETSAIGCGV
jgi:hypothetical protein